MTDILPLMTNTLSYEPYLSKYHPEKELRESNDNREYCMYEVVVRVYSGFGLKRASVSIWNSKARNWLDFGTRGVV